MFEFGLFKNHLTPDPDDYMAKMQNVRVATSEDILKEMNVPGGVTKAQAAVVITARKVAIMKLLSRGYAIRTELVEINPAVRGVFIDVDDNFDPKRHTIVLNTEAREDLKIKARELEVKKVKVIGRIPMPERFIDTATQRRNEVISRGKVGELKGSNLKVDPEDTDQGVFIIKADGTEVRCDNFMHNSLVKLQFYVPDDLPAGEEVTLEVRTDYNLSSKELRTGRFQQTLSVI